MRASDNGFRPSTPSPRFSMCDAVPPGLGRTSFAMSDSFDHQHDDRFGGGTVRATDAALVVPPRGVAPAARSALQAMRDLGR